MATVSVYGQLTMQVKDGGYDEQFEPEASGIVTMGDQGVAVLPLRGFKGH